MSVLEYIYPEHPHRLTTATVSAAFERAAPKVTLEWEHRPRAVPAWSAVTVAHPRPPKVRSVFVVARNSAAQKRDLATRYEGDANLAAVLSTPVLIWSQLRVPLSTPLAAIPPAFDLHYALLAAISGAGGGVVDLPENERLYSVEGFRRHAKRLTRRRSRPGRRVGRTKPSR